VIEKAVKSSNHFKCLSNDYHWIASRLAVPRQEHSDSPKIISIRIHSSDSICRNPGGDKEGEWRPGWGRVRRGPSQNMGDEWWVMTHARVSWSWLSCQQR